MGHCLCFLPFKVVHYIQLKSGAYPMSPPSLHTVCPIGGVGEKKSAVHSYDYESVTIVRYKIRQKLLISIQINWQMFGYIQLRCLSYFDVINAKMHAIIKIT